MKKIHLFKLVIVLLIGLFVSSYAGKLKYQPDANFYERNGNTLVTFNNDEFWVNIDTLKSCHFSSFKGKSIMIQWECGQVYTYIDESGKVFNGAHGSMPYEEPSTVSLDKTLARMRVDYGRPERIIVN